MTDEERQKLVDGLRHLPQYLDELGSDAADEIERLAKEVETVKGAEPVTDDWIAMLAEATALVVRKRREAELLELDAAFEIKQLAAKIDRLADKIFNLAVAEKQDHGATDRREAENERQDDDRPIE